MLTFLIPEFITYRHVVNTFTEHFGPEGVWSVEDLQHTFVFKITPILENNYYFRILGVLCTGSFPIPIRRF